MKLGSEHIRGERTSDASITNAKSLGSSRTKVNNRVIYIESTLPISPFRSLHYINPPSTHLNNNVVYPSCSLQRDPHAP